MKNLLSFFVLLLIPMVGTKAVSAEETLTFGPFGKVAVYQSESSPANVVLFISGDGGWNLGVIDMARALSKEHSLVVGIDIIHYFKHLNQGKGCAYPAADLENLSKYVQKKKGFKVYTTPVLVGYSSGATLAYAALVQAPPNTFRGAISLGFCPTLEMIKPFCKGYGLEWTRDEKQKEVYLLPAKNLENPWIAFQGNIDQVCNSDVTTDYVKQVTNGKLVLLPKVGHGFSVQRNWMPQFRENFLWITKSGSFSGPSADGDLSDLPVVELPVKGQGDTLALIVSGDGGWASLDRDIGKYLEGLGIPVVGLDSLRYFWSARTPEEISKDLNRILTHYLSAWGKKKAVLIGYSMGADVLPFMVRGLPKEIQSRVSGLVLLGPSMTAKFEFHIEDWLGIPTVGKNYPILPELDRIAGPHILCLAGDDEEDSLCRKVDSSKVAVEILSGGHHFSGDYTHIGQIIVRRMELK